MTNSPTPETDYRRLAMTVRNSRDREIGFVLEPWGEVYALQPGDVLQLEFDGPSDGEPEVDVEEEAITVWGWSGSTVELRLNGQALSPDYRRPRVPPRLDIVRKIISP